MNKNRYQDKFIFNLGKQWIAISVSEISCFYRESINFIYTFTGEKYMLDFAKLKKVEEFLDPKQSNRSNRQSIININAIQIVKPHENQKLTVSFIQP